MWVAKVPLWVFIISAERWGDETLPGVPNVKRPGLAFMRAKNSFTLLAGTFCGFTSRNYPHPRSRRYRYDVFSGVKGHLGVNVRVDADRAAVGHEPRIAVRGGFGQRISGNIASGARAALNHYWLAQRLLQWLRNDARNLVCRAARREAHNHPHRLGGPDGCGLGPG